MSWKASAIAKELTQGLHGERLSMADKLVLMILSENYIEKQGYVWCSQSLLAEQCLCTSRGLRGIMERLERFGLIGIVHRGRRGNLYSFPFMGNAVPQSINKIEERIEERHDTIEERHALLEERAGSSRTVDGNNGTDGTAIGACPECGARQDLCMGHRKKKVKTWPQRQRFEKEVHRVEEKPARSRGEEARDGRAKAFEIYERTRKASR